MAWAILLILILVKIVPAEKKEFLRQQLHKKLKLYQLVQYVRQVKNKILKNDKGSMSWAEICLYFLFVFLPWIASICYPDYSTAIPFLMALLVVCFSIWIVYFLVEDSLWYSEIISIIIVLMILVPYWSTLTLMFLYTQIPCYAFLSAVSCVVISGSLLWKLRVFNKHPVIYLCIWCALFLFNFVAIGYSFGLYTFLNDGELYAHFGELAKRDVWLAFWQVVYVGWCWSINGNSEVVGVQSLLAVAKGFGYDNLDRLLAWGIIFTGVNLFYFLKPWVPVRKA